MSSTLRTNRSDVGLGSTNIPEKDLVRPLTEKGLQLMLPSLPPPSVCRIVTRSTLDCCSFHSWSVLNFFIQVDLDPFLLQKLPLCALLSAIGVILL